MPSLARRSRDQSKVVGQQDTMQPRWCIGENKSGPSVVYPLSGGQFIQMNPAALCVMSRVIAITEHRCYCRDEMVNASSWRTKNKGKAMNWPSQRPTHLSRTSRLINVTTSGLVVTPCGQDWRPCSSQGKSRYRHNHGYPGYRLRRRNRCAG